VGLFQFGAKNPKKCFNFSAGSIDFPKFRAYYTNSEFKARVDHSIRPPQEI